MSQNGPPQLASSCGVQAPRLQQKGEIESAIDNRTRSGGVARALPQGTQPVRLNILYIVVLAFSHILAMLAFFPWFFSWTGVITMLAGVYVFGGLGINLCFHRLLSHRSFECPRWFEYSLAILGSLSVQESPVWWAAVHRLHHRQSDEQDDPHTPHAGFFWAHIGWILFRNRQYADRETMYSHVRDLVQQPFYVRIDGVLFRTLLLIPQYLIYFGLGFMGGWMTDGNTSSAVQLGCSVLIWGVFVRTVVVMHTTWAVNSIAHRWGYRNYETPDDSRNNILCGIVAHGDGWHNNPHAKPHLAKHGLKWWEVDTVYLAICLLEKLGLIWNVRRDLVEH